MWCPLFYPDVSQWLVLTYLLSNHGKKGRVVLLKVASFRDGSDGGLLGYFLVTSRLPDGSGGCLATEYIQQEHFF